jgi:hypothetical protein
MYPPPRLFDHLVGAGEHSRRDIEAERLGGLEVYDQFELGRLLHGQVSRFLALQDAVKPPPATYMRLPG